MSKEGIPAVRRCKGSELGDFHLVVRRIAIAISRAVPLGCRYRRFQRDNSGCRTGGIGLLCEREQLHDVSGVCGAGFLHFRVVLQIVIAIRQAETGLSDLHDVHIRPFRILAHSNADRRIDAESGEVRKCCGKLHRVSQGGDGFHLTRERGDPKLLDSCRIHVAGVQVTNLSLDGARRRVAL